MGRRPKPRLTGEEVQAITGKGNRIAAAIISQMRGAEAASLTNAQRNARRVSYVWIMQQRRGLVNNGTGKETGGGPDESSVTNESGTAYSASRVPPESPSDSKETETPYFAAQKAQAPASHGVQVETAGAKA